MIRIGIYGYGNLGRGVESAIRQNDDMELVAVFTRRAPETLKIRTEGVKVCHVDDALKMIDDIDVMILCGGSATDLPVQTPELSKYFNVVDSFDTHARIPEHFANVDAEAKKSGKVALISVGWDPGMFSLNRLYASAILPDGKDYTFWGKGVSQGHSDAIRRVEGVLDGKQYTIPVDEALEAVRSGSCPELTTRQKHIPLNSYVSLNKPIYEEESDRTLMDVITEGRSSDPEELLIGQENYVSIESRIQEALSPLERKVLAAYLDGKSYQEIAVMLDRHVKSIDNALQRVKHKLEKLIRERNS